MSVRSSMPSQEAHWRPVPSRPPAPTSASGLSRRRVPPRGLCTMPVRTHTTRRPASLAGALATLRRGRGDCNFNGVTPETEEIPVTDGTSSQKQDQEPVELSAADEQLLRE